MAHQDVDIELTVRHVRAETPQHLSVVYERPRGFEYEAGDWIDLRFDTDLRGGRTYSLSSSPTEPDLMITFTEGQSEIKRTLAASSPGDTARITAFGNDYDFQLDEHRDSVLIAGGVGAAPFRGMLRTAHQREVVDGQRPGSVDLVHLNATDAFLFRDELDTWRSEMSDVRIHRIVTKGLHRKDRERVLRDVIPVTAHHYYIAGSEGMIETTETLLDSMGVDHDDIRIDVFGGY